MKLCMIVLIFAMYTIDKNSKYVPCNGCYYAEKIYSNGAILNGQVCRVDEWQISEECKHIASRDISTHHFGEIK